MDARDFTVDSLTAAYSGGSFSPVDAAKACLDRVSDIDGELNAFVLVDPERALMQARESEQRWLAGSPLSPIDGVPTSIKDLVLVKGWPTLKGSPHLNPNELATQTAPVAQRLLDAGAVFIGKTTTPESGWKGLTDSPIGGYTRNPWNPERTSGGSSGGAAVAAATGMAPGAARAAAPPAPTGKLEAGYVNHISYSVKDYAKCRDFYVDLLGMKVTEDDGKQYRKP